MSAQDLKERGDGEGYILVDFDRTLVRYRSWALDGTNFGVPIPAMVERVQRWLHLGKEVRIFTARASRHDPAEITKIETWCQDNFGKVLKVQNWKDFHCTQIWDDLAVTVEANTGLRLSVGVEDDPLKVKDEVELVDAAVTAYEQEQSRLDSP
jgi:hypothetical protein